MPLCARCSNPFVCNCGNQLPKKLGAEAEDCPLTKDGAVWVHVVDDRGIDVMEVGTKKDTDRKPTDRGGTAVFDPVPPGPHTVDLDPLSEDILKLFEKPTAPTPRPVTVAPGQIAYVQYQLARKPSLSVQVVTKKGPRKLFGGATVTVSGPEQPTGDTIEGNGTADLGHVPAGKYEIKVKLADKDAETFATTLDFAEETAKAALAPGEARVVTVEVEPINVVTSEVTIDQKSLIIDHWPDNSEALVACAELSVKQTNRDHRYAKQIALTCVSETDVEAFWDEKCLERAKFGSASGSGTPLPGKKQDELRDSKPVKVYFRGKSKAGTFAISLELEEPADRFVKLGEKTPAAEAEIALLVRPHVKIEWVDGVGVDAVKVKLNGHGADHDIPDSSDGGFAKWVERGIKPGAYKPAFTFPGGVKYLLHGADGQPVEDPELDLQPGGKPVTYKIKKVKAKLAVACDVGGVAEDVEAKVKVKLVGTAVTLKGKGAVPVEIPVVEVDQKCEIETLTIDGADVYELVGVETTT